MPLPPYLLERLKRRRIIQSLDKEEEDEPSVEQKDKNDLDQEQEEIIAEDYSDGDQPPRDEGEKEDSPQVVEDEEAISDCESQVEADGTEAQITQDDQVDSILGCPNKYNIYHSCSSYCAETYANPDPKPTLEQRKHLALILRTYPMSNEWSVVYDPGVKTFYFWNIISNLVSWLPPGMNGYVSISADQVRKTLRESLANTSDNINSLVDE